MIKAKFKYTDKMLTQINKNATKVANLICEIAVLIIFAGALVLMFTGSVALSVIMITISVLLVISRVITNKSIQSSNRIYYGQEVTVVFNDKSLQMTTIDNVKVLHDITIEYVDIKKIVEKTDFVYMYIDKKSAIIIPKTSFKTIKDYNKALQLAGNNYMV